MRIIDGGDGLWDHPAELGVQNAAKKNPKNKNTTNATNWLDFFLKSTEMYTRRLKQIRYHRRFAECAG